MNGIVVIPCYNRPAFLKVCIDHILKADQAETMRYIFAIDSGGDGRNVDIIKQFPFEHAVLQRQTKVIGIGKQSNNVLMGLKAAYENCEVKPIYYIEDDVFIGRDFFTFGAKILQDSPNVFCAILSKNVNGNEQPTDDVNAYYLKHSNEYQGIGSILNPSMFSYLMPHICVEYVTSPKVYCQTTFPHTALGADYCEQDGLIRRIIEDNALPVAFAHVPRCFHAGFFGYHRMVADHIKRLPIEAQAAKIYEIAFDVEKLRKIAQAENLVYDSMPQRLDTQHIECKFLSIENTTS